MINKIIELGFSKLEANELLSKSKNIEKDYSLLLKGYPIQYLIGNVNFYGYKINVNKNVLIPRYETEGLVEKTIIYINEMFKTQKLDVLDLCTGSGAIAIVLKSKLKNSTITASDISKKALEVSKINAKENNVNITFIQSDLLNNINDKYDVIISNPPYISEDEEIMEIVRKHEPHQALYASDNGLYFYKNIINDSKKNLNKKFIIALEIGCDQGNSVKEYAKLKYPSSKIIIEKDLSNKDRYVFIINN
ncbi:MAG: peptide chain release factor N(5)-glutamine methyltransferase [Tenericutes bacterium]|nr:peptide chain release factor N(5)-glutamine methyltransferase [Mycoplasmatota bacterium]